jgi:hypothetical protein
MTMRLLKVTNYEYITKYYMNILSSQKSFATWFSIMCYSGGVEQITQAEQENRQKKGVN